MKWLKTLCVVGILQVMAMTPGHAQSELEQIKSSGAFKIGTEGTYAPFTYHDASGALVGFDVEVGREIAKRMGVKAEFLEGKWDGLIAGLDAKRYNAVINQVGITEARKAKYDFSQPYIASKAVLIVRGDNTTIKSFADLRGKKSAQSLTSNYAKLAETNGAQLVATEGFDQAIQLVLVGRADATLNDNLSFLDFKKHKPDANVKVVTTQENAEHSGVLIRKGEPDLLAAINAALDAIKADGTYQRIAETYFGQDVSR